ncbi:Hypp556 [Branchiostoma lanceolatum]|uniref:Hypp556 protein n=1 Tax=Branchiostoma lanceolatum TaxID=7740 RepID=A0A8J9VBA6_BRALA|nr:Hypp556 [Branchiostoma lanceolatum]
MPRRRPSKEKDTDDMEEKLPPNPTLFRCTCTAVMMTLMSAHLAPVLTLLITFLTFFPAATQDDIGFDSGKSSPGHQALPLTVHRTLIVMGILTVCIILACACFGVFYRRRIRAQERADEDALNAPPPSYYDVVTEPVEITDETAGASATHPADSPPTSPAGHTASSPGSQDFVHTTTHSQQHVITPLSVQALLRGVRMSRLAAQELAESQRHDRSQHDDAFEEPPPTYDTYMNYSVTPTQISDD